MKFDILIVDSNNNNLTDDLVKIDDNTFSLDRAYSMQDAIIRCDVKKYAMICINAASIRYRSLLQILGEHDSFIYIVSPAPTLSLEIEAIQMGADYFGTWLGDGNQELRRSISLLLHYLQRLSINKKKRYKCIQKYNILIIPEYRQVFINDYNVDLTRKEFDLLYLLISDTNRVFTYDIIFRNVWKEEYLEVDKTALWNLITRLRKKTNSYEGMSDFIKNVHDIGYAFTH